MKLCAKFGENWTNGSGVIQVFANFNMAAGGHLGLRISKFWDHRLVPGAKWMIHTKFGACRTNRFVIIQFLVDFGFSSAAILDLEKITVLSLTLSVWHQGEAPYQIWRESVQRF